ncbi:MAG: OmpA family protein [Paludibacteraceae bacterium]|nr:OmpA family protein [Paludibacteraceae bacterium]
MKNIISTILLVVPALAGAMESLECNYAGKYLNVSDLESVSHLSDTTVAFKQGDSVFVARINDLGAVYDAKYNDLLTSLKPEGQIAYDGKESYYFTNDGKMYYAKVKNGKVESKTKIEIPGTVMKRESYDHSALVYASWHYKPQDTIRISNPAISKNGKQLFFSGNLKDSKGRDIYSSQVTSPGVVTQPRKLGRSVNSDANEDNPYIRKDGQITFISNRKNATSEPEAGKSNVYISKTNGSTAPELMQAFVDRNTPKVEEVVNVEPTPDTTPAVAPVVLPDTTTLAIVEDKPVEEPKVVVEPENDNVQNENDRILDALAYESDTTKYPISAQELSKVFQEDQDAMVMASKHVVAGVNKRIFYFDYDSDELNGDYDKDIECIIDFINFYKGNSFLIIGHTDERGSYEYNDALSLRRAKQIETILAKRGVSRSKLFVMGLGEYRPVIRNAKTEEQHQKNRRVEILKME